MELFNQDPQEWKEMLKRIKGIVPRKILKTYKLIHISMNGVTVSEDTAFIKNYLNERGLLTEEGNEIFTEKWRRENPEAGLMICSDSEFIFALYFPGSCI